MRILRLALALGIVTVALAPAVSADVAVRTCDTPTFCHDVVRVEGPLTCNVDIMKKGLGKPPGVRLSDCM